jgi:hypothetical protein
MAKDLKQSEVMVPVPVPAGVAAEDIATVMKQFEGALGALVAQQAQEISQRRQSQEESAHIRRECEKTAAQRTQEAADRLYQGPRRYRVSIPRDRMHVVPIAIAAHSEDEARGRFASLCGIKSSEWDYVVEAAS